MAVEAKKGWSGFSGSVLSVFLVFAPCIVGWFGVQNKGETVVMGVARIVLT